MDAINHPALTAQSWTARNHAVKALCDEERGPRVLAVLIEVVRDRRPAPWWKRLLGERFAQVGFIRRNAWRGLAAYRIPSVEVEELALLGFSDPYFEARAQACATAAAQAREHGHVPEPGLAAGLEALLASERNPEVLAAALRAAPWLLGPEAVGRLAARHAAHGSGLVREAWVDFLRLALERRALDAATVRGMLGRTAFLSESFLPRFSIRERLAALDKALQEHQAGT